MSVHVRFSQRIRFGAVFLERMRMINPSHIAGVCMPSITVTWPVVENEHGWDMLWFGAWLVGNDGSEGPWFYNGRGGESSSYDVPPVATGVRFRRWPNEGLDAEY